MIYRIRYMQEHSRQEAEATVEANTPNEAIVKFQCTRDGRERQWKQERVVSISPENEPVTW